MIRRTLSSSLSLLLLVSSATALTAAGDPALLTSPKNGQVLHTPGVEAIFWGAEWTDPSFDGDIISGIDTLLAGYNNSAYAQSPSEYYDKQGHVTPFATYWGHIMDTSASPGVGAVTPAVAIAEACKMTGNNPDPGGIYAVFTSVEGGVANNNCAFHTSGVCGSGRKAVPIQVAAVPYASGVAGTGCDGVQDTVTGHSLVLAQIANLTMHEVIEAITDPRGSGWHDGNGEEIADKCIRIFRRISPTTPCSRTGRSGNYRGCGPTRRTWPGVGRRTRSGSRPVSGRRADGPALRSSTPALPSVGAVESR